MTFVQRYLGITCVHQGISHLEDSCRLLGFLVPLRFHEDQQELMATAHKNTLYSQLPDWALREGRREVWELAGSLLRC